MRFYGNNISYSANYLDKQDSEKLADKFAKIGYNAVRIHHFDDQLILKNQKTSTELDPARLDKLDYLFFCFKNKGIYITTDIYVSRELKKNEISEFPEASGTDLKALVPILPSARENWKIFAANLLTHKNPYTGMTWAEDPALFSFAFLNENTIYSAWSKKSKIAALYNEKFLLWKQKKNIKIFDTEEDTRMLLQFLTETHIESFEELKHFVRSLGCNSLLSDANWKDIVYQALIREKLDYVDNHAYWDYPRFIEQSYQIPYGHLNKSVLSKLAMVPRSTMPTRIFGKPFTVTEFNYLYPNGYRAESGVIMGAYAALQGWDGLYRYAYAHNSKTITNNAYFIKGFDSAHDPIASMSDKIGILLFLRGDINEADEAVPLVYSEKFLFSKDAEANFPDKYDYLGLTKKIGCININELGKTGLTSCSNLFSKNENFSEYSQAKIKKWDESFFSSFINPTFNPSNGIAESSQIQIDANVSEFKVQSSKTEVLIIHGKKKAQSALMTISNDGGCAVFCLTSMDSLPLQGSKRMLFFHLTDVQNSKIKFGNTEKTILEDWGDWPLLLKIGKAVIEIKLSGELTVQALSMDGKPIQKISVAKSAKGSFFSIDNFPGQAVMAYEIIKF